MNRGALRAAIAVLLVLGAVVVAVRSGRTPTRTITATFAQAPGLYVGNHVDVLSIPVGSITHITPGPSGVEVTMRVADNVRIPADAQAVLMAPQVVNDRFVELTPAYDGGPTMAPGTHIPLSRTAEPLSVDEILGSLDSLLQALGPSAASQKGLLGSLVGQLTGLLGNQGANLHHTIDATSAAVGALASDSPQLSSLLDQLSSLVGSLAADAGNYASFTNTMASATADLAGDRTVLGSALATLQSTLGEVSSFVEANQSNLGASLDNIDHAVATLAGSEHQLGQALEITPLAIQNLGRTVHPTSTGNAVEGRFDPIGNSLPLVNQVCGNLDFRMITLSQKQKAAPVTDPVCTFGAVAANFRLPPGAGPGPILTLPALIEAQAKS